MKRSLSVIALATLATGAYAQSNVTLYGRVNTSVESQKVDDTRSTVMQDNSSRWGLKGFEDLGGGLKASFLLEGGFAADTGAGTGGFGRESWVGLETATAGKLRLGNVSSTATYFALVDPTSNHNHDTGTSADAFYFYQGTSTNTVAYTSPSLGGFVVEGQYGLKETGKRATKVLAANYDVGAFRLGAGYVDGTDNSGADADRAKQFGLRALYQVGDLTLGGYWINDKIIDLPGGVGDAKRNAYRLVAQYNIGASELHANLGLASKVKIGGVTVADSAARQFTLGYNYNLSKRTKVYAFYTRIDNQANAAYSMPGTTTTVAGSDPSSLAFGIRHDF